jgi:hypothetical protein
VRYHGFGEVRYSSLTFLTNFLQSDQGERDGVDIILSHDCHWKQRAVDAEQKLSVEHKKNVRAYALVRKLRGQLDEYCEALGRSTEDCGRALDQCRTLADTNLRLGREFQRAKLMVETLESVLMMFYTHPSTKTRLMGRDPSSEERANSVPA